MAHTEYTEGVWMPSIEKLLSDCATLFQRLVRMEAADDNGICKCITCGREGDWRQLEGGHFISRTYKAVVISPQNVNPQCRYCNHDLDGNLEEYERILRWRHGDACIDMMIAAKRGPHGMSKAFLIDKKKEFNRRLRIQQDRLAGL